MVVVVTNLRQLRFPSWGPQLIAAALTIVGLLPLLVRLPRVAVVACFDAGHPLYSWVPTTEVGGAVHCLTAPAPVVSWTLMVASTLLVHVVLVPMALLAVVLLLSGARWLAGAGRRLLATVLAWFDGLVVNWWRPAPLPAPVLVAGAGWARANPLRGPPAFS